PRASDRPARLARSGRIRARLAPARPRADPTLVVCRSVVGVRRRPDLSVGAAESAQKSGGHLVSSASGELRTRNLRTLAVLAGLFLLPLLASFWMYYGTDWRPATRVNHGELITPARPLPQVNLPVVLGAPARGSLFRHTWTLVYVGPGTCDDSC